MRWIDKDGRDSDDPFQPKIEAANDFARYYNGTSVIINKEFASTIYQNSNGTYSYNVARIGGLGWSATNYDMPEGAIHTHGGDDPRFGDGSYDFSSEDIEGDGTGDKAAAERNGQNEYVVTPGGELLEYDIKSKETLKPVGAATDIPSDPKSGAKRVNQVEAKDTKPYYIDRRNTDTRPFSVTDEYNKPEKK